MFSVCHTLPSPCTAALQDLCTCCPLCPEGLTYICSVQDLRLPVSSEVPQPRVPDSLCDDPFPRAQPSLPLGGAKLDPTQGSMSSSPQPGAGLEASRWVRDPRLCRMCAPGDTSLQGAGDRPQSQDTGRWKGGQRDWAEKTRPQGWERAAGGGAGPSENVLAGKDLKATFLNVLTCDVGPDRSPRESPHSSAPPPSMSTWVET